jgi:hypothetical protein
MPEPTINKLFKLKERNNQMADTNPDGSLKVTVILKNYFGIKEDGSITGLQGFLAELKELSAEEKLQLAEGIHNGSFNY